MKQKIVNVRYTLRMSLEYSGTCLMKSPMGPYFLGWMRQVLLFKCDNVSSLLSQLPVRVYTYFQV